MTSDDSRYIQIPSDDNRLHQICNQPGYCIIEKLEYWDIGILRYYNIEILVYWDIGILRYWNIEIFEYWDIGIFKYWNIEKLEYWDFGILINWNIQMTSDDIRWQLMATDDIKVNKIYKFWICSRVIRILRYCSN